MAGLEPAIAPKALPDPERIVISNLCARGDARVEPGHDVERPGHDVERPEIDVGTPEIDVEKIVVFAFG